MERQRHSEPEASVDPDLVLYPGVHVSFLVPRSCDTALLDAAIGKIKMDIGLSLEAHLPAGCVGRLEKLA